MSFLAKRKASRTFTDSANLTEAPTLDQTYKPSSTLSIKSTSTFRRRLSSLTFFTSKRPKASSSRCDASGGIGFDARFRADSLRSESPSPTPSLEEIRRPSGLGRRVSITAHSLEQEIDWHEPNATSSRPPRKASVSTPNLPSTFPALERWELSETEDTTEDDHVHEPPCMFTKIPPELLNAMFAYVSPPGLASLARVCKSFLQPSRVLLYSNVDLMPVTNQKHVAACIHTLASKRDLAKLVRRFACNSITEAHPASFTSPLSTVSFAIALSNMTDLVSLKVQRFDPSYFLHTTFQLQSLTLLWETVTPEDLQGIFAWLTGQTSLTSLCFPNLTLDERTSDILSGAGNALSEHTSDDPQAPDYVQSLLSFSFVSRLLPRLKRLHGPSSIVAALAPGRPLDSITMHIHSTIYNGLRPSALMSVISQVTNPVSHLAIITTSRNPVDARSLERVLMAAGAELGSSLKVVEVESTLEDEVLFKQIYGVLVRYRALHTLRLWRASGAYLTPPATPCAIPTTPITPTSSTPSTRANTAIPLRTLERALLGQWHRQCSALRSVTFPSGHRWRITDDVGGPIFTFVGFV